MKNIAIYFRVSTTGQDTDSQEQVVNKWVSQHPSISSVVIFREKASGKRDDRPEFNRMLEHARIKAFDTLVVYKLDRLSRSASTAIRTILSLDDLGVAFVSVTQSALNLAHDIPFRRTILMAFAEIAQIEHEMISSRVKDGLAAAKARGKRLGRKSVITDTLRDQVISLQAKGYSLRRVAQIAKVSLGTTHKILSST